MVVNFFKKLDKLITHIEEWALFVIVMFALMALFANVVLRYGFNYTLAWSEELVRIVIIYTTFIGASVAVRTRSMIRIDALVQLIPGLKKGLLYYSNFLMLIFSGMMMYYGYKMAALMVTTHQKTIIMQIPLVYLYSIMPVMGIMVFMRTIQVYYQDFKENKS